MENSLSSTLLPWAAEDRELFAAVKSKLSVAANESLPESSLQAFLQGTPVCDVRQRPPPSKRSAEFQSWKEGHPMTMEQGALNLLPSVMMLIVPPQRAYGRRALR